MTSPAPCADPLEPSATVSVTLAVTRFDTGGDSSVRPLRAPRWTAANAAARLIQDPVTPAGYADPEPHRAHPGRPAGR
ncbi:hypothetical protein GQ649_14135 [Rhodococcus sp. DSM 6344]|nr:hypothetical protein [Rhodococcus erythropolis]